MGYYRAYAIIFAMVLVIRLAFSVPATGDNYAVSKYVSSVDGASVAEGNLHVRTFTTAQGSGIGAGQLMTANIGLFSLTDTRPAPATAKGAVPASGFDGGLFVPWAQFDDAATLSPEPMPPEKTPLNASKPPSGTSSSTPENTAVFAVTPSKRLEKPEAIPPASYPYVFLVVLLGIVVVLMLLRKRQSRH